MQSRMPYEGGHPYNYGPMQGMPKSNRPAGMVPPGPQPGSTFAGGSFSPRRKKMALPEQSMAPRPSDFGMMPHDLPGQRVGWGGQPLPPGLMKKQAGIPNPIPLPPVPGAAPPAASAPMHRMPNGSMMPGATHPGFMPPGQRRKMGRRIVKQNPGRGPMWERRIERLTQPYGYQ